MITYPCQPSAFSHNPAALVQLPWYGLMVLGCYALLCLAIDFWHFNDVTQASDELGQVRLAAVCGCDSAVRLIGAASCVPYGQQIKEAKSELKAKGFTFLQDS